MKYWYLTIEAVSKKGHKLKFEEFYKGSPKFYKGSPIGFIRYLNNNTTGTWINFVLINALEISKQEYDKYKMKGS